MQNKNYGGQIFKQLSLILRLIYVHCEMSGRHRKYKEKI